MRPMQVGEIERAVAAYLGSKTPIAGSVPIGAHHVPPAVRVELGAGFAKHGLEMSIEEHEEEETLAMLKLVPSAKAETAPALEASEHEEA